MYLYVLEVAYPLTKQLPIFPVNICNKKHMDKNNKKYIINAYDKKILFTTSNYSDYF